jgi:hypothetical protein
VSGVILGIRYFKGTENVGEHVGSLWTADGQRLASAVFASESPSGWQEVRFPAPVPIQANTTYVGSYHTDVGFYAANRSYFDVALTRGPLTALPDGDGGNGVFRYGASAFPDQAYFASNYWVDVVFDSAADLTPPAIGDVRVTDIGDAAATIRWRTDEPADSVVDFGATPAYGGVAAPDGGLVTDHAVRLTGLAPNAGYHARSRSRDAAGNLAQSPDFTFTTAGVPPAPPPAQACIPRPNVATSLVRDGPERLRVTIAAHTTATTPDNRLAGIRFLPGVNALVDVGGQVGRTGGFTVAFPDGPRQTDFYVRRATPGQPVTLPLVVIDSCGEFRTFVGGGVNAF